MIIEPWKRIEPTTVTKVGWRTIVSKTFIMSNGKKTVFDTMWPDGQQFAATIALTPDKQVVVCRMFRAGPEKIMDELPGGFVEIGEDIKSTVERELLEETGYRSGAIEFIGSAHKDTYLNAVWHFFLATDCVLEGEPELDVEEQIEIKLISIDQLIANAKQDRMTDVTAVLMAYDQLKEITEGRSKLE